MDGDGGHVSTFTENRTYNTDLELTELTSGTNVHYRFGYASGQDNGQIASQTDVISGEVISYQYDTLERLISASATARAFSPQSWNRYAYVENDPANQLDPSGLQIQFYNSDGYSGGATDGDFNNYSGAGCGCIEDIFDGGLPSAPAYQGDDSPGAFAGFGALPLDNGTLLTGTDAFGTYTLYDTASCPPNCGSTAANVDQYFSMLNEVID